MTSLSILIAPDGSVDHPVPSMTNVPPTVVLSSPSGSTKYAPGESGVESRLSIRVAFGAGSAT